jgi:hypothetical protein
MGRNLDNYDILKDFHGKIQIEKSKDKEGDIFRQKIYRDKKKKQYSLKLSAVMMDFVKFDEGDYFEFIVDKSKKEPTIIGVYKKNGL